MPYKDKLKQKESHRLWHLKNREVIREKQRIYWWRLKLKVFGKYCGKTIRCACCSEQEIKFLSIDHINGGGTKHRALIGGHRLYHWLIQNNFPEGYRILCHNCNQAIGSYGICPHQIRAVRDSYIGNMYPSQG